MQKFPKLLVDVGVAVKKRALDNFAANYQLQQYYSTKRRNQDAWTVDHLIRQLGVERRTLLQYANIQRVRAGLSIDREINTKLALHAKKE